MMCSLGGRADNFILARYHSIPGNPPMTLTDVGGQDATQETLFTVLDIRERQSTGWRSMEKFNYKWHHTILTGVPAVSTKQITQEKKRTNETRNLNKFPQNTKKKLICSVCSQADHEEWRCTTRYLLEWIELQLSANIHRWSTTGTN